MPRDAKTIRVAVPLVSGTSVGLGEPAGAAGDADAGGAVGVDATGVDAIVGVVGADEAALAAGTVGARLGPAIVLGGVGAPAQPATSSSTMPSAAAVRGAIIGVSNPWRWWQASSLRRIRGSRSQ
jgi:hypothetical protein